MRSLTAFCLTMLFASTAHAAFPYLVKIKMNGAELRCGPGDEYYSTQRLDQGTQIEVYRRESNGWLAIRPPAGSFSWVSTASLRPTANPSIAEVVGLRAVSWIGSETHDVVDHKWQVRLQPDEQIEALGRDSLRVFQGSGVTAVTRIAPPAGEFRWIHESATRRQIDSANGDDPQNAVIEPAVFRGPESSGDDHAGRSSVDSNVDPDGNRVSQLASGRVTEDAGRGNGGAVTDANTARSIRLVDLDLALELTRQPHEWDLAPMRQRIGELLARASSTVARARARRIQQKLEEFELLRIRYLGLGPRDQVVTAPAAHGEAVSLTALQTNLEDSPRFDGRGWLLPVHSKQRQSPPYALLDDEGKILQFVSPAPGLNLHRYLRRRVGIVGQKAPTSFLDKPQLTAHRVVDLARH